jgi:hypothetical protein
MSILNELGEKIEEVFHHHKYAFGKKQGPDPNAGLFPKAVLDLEVPKKNIEYQYLFSPIENQGGAGACVAFGCGSVFEAYYRKRKGATISVSKRAIYSIAKHESNPPDLTDDGLFVSQGLQVLQKGYILSNDFPYSDRPSVLFDVPNTVLEKTDEEIASFAAVEIDSVTPATTAANLVAALYKHGPIAIGVNFPSVWMDPKGRLTETGLDDSAGGHCMALVDAMWNEETNGFDAVIRNSWGTGWGNKGYGIVSMNALAQVITDAYVVTVEA